MELPFVKFQAQYTNMENGAIDNSVVLSDVRSKACLLPPYKNNKTEFYNTLYHIPALNKHFAFFGHDFTGCFFVNKEDSSIGYMFENDELTNTAYCNSTINLFITFHNLFINLITRIISIEILDTDKQIATLEKLYSEIDRRVMADENNFWVMRLYELSEDFFPLDDSRIKLYQSL
ncbi:hypothetical protein KAM380_049320 [Aeromonas caviae]|nr:hypothetical protein KAM380_049320 [Aeromonas caviae]